MKKIIIYSSLLITAITFFTACKKETQIVAAYSSVENKAFVRFIHSSPSFRQVFNAPDSFNIFINDAKVNASLLTYAGAFPASGTQYGYIAIPTGLQNIRLTVAGRVTPDSIPLILFTKVFSQGQYYSIIVTDNIKSANDSSKIILPDSYTVPGNGNYSMRFVHAVLNDTAGLKIDVFSARRNANILNAISPGQIVNFQTLPFNSQITDTLTVRRAGTLQSLATVNGITFGNQRVYTIVYRGDGTLTAGTKARGLATFIHQ